MLENLHGLIDLIPLVFLGLMNTNSRGTRLPGGKVAGGAMDEETTQLYNNARDAFIQAKREGNTPGAIAARKRMDAMETQAHKARLNEQEAKIQNRLDRHAESLRQAYNDRDQAKIDRLSQKNISSKELSDFKRERKQQLRAAEQLRRQRLMRMSEAMVNKSKQKLEKTMSEN